MRHDLAWHDLGDVANAMTIEDAPRACDDRGTGLELGELRVRDERDIGRSGHRAVERSRLELAEQLALRRGRGLRRFELRVIAARLGTQALDLDVDAGGVLVARGDLGHPADHRFTAAQSAQHTRVLRTAQRDLGDLACELGLLDRELIANLFFAIDDRAFDETGLEIRARSRHEHLLACVKIFEASELMLHQDDLLGQASGFDAALFGLPGKRASGAIAERRQGDDRAIDRGDLAIEASDLRIESRELREVALVCEPELRDRIVIAREMERRDPRIRDDVIRGLPRPADRRNRRAEQAQRKEPPRDRSCRRFERRLWDQRKLVALDDAQHANGGLHGVTFVTAWRVAASAATPARRASSSRISTA